MNAILKLATTQQKLDVQAKKARAPKPEPQAPNVALYVSKAQELGHVVAEGFILNSRLGVIADSLNTACAVFKAEGITIGNRTKCPVADAICDAISQEYKERGQKLNAGTLKNILICLRKSVQVGYWLGYNPTDASNYLEKALDEPAVKSLDELKQKTGTVKRANAKKTDIAPREGVSDKKPSQPKGVELVVPLRALFSHKDISRLKNRMSDKAWKELVTAAMMEGLKAEDIK